MKCLTPASIPRPNGRGSADRLTVPCGKCVHCLATKRHHWSIRLENELQYSDYALFVTLTYDDEHIYYNENGFPSVSKRDVQLFFKRFRKSCKHRIRYYLTAEYGPKTCRPHYHIILFFSIDTPWHPLDIYTLIDNAWEKGNIDVGKVTSASINYVTKYCITKNDKILGVDEPFSLMSRRPGLGYQYIEKMKSWHLADVDLPRYYITKPNGIKVGLPRYYRDKIYSKEQIEHMTERFKSVTNDDFELDRRKFDSDGQYFKYQLDKFDSYVNNYTRKLTKTNKL